MHLNITLDVYMKGVNMRKFKVAPISRISYLMENDKTKSIQNMGESIEFFNKLYGNVVRWRRVGGKQFISDRFGLLIKSFDMYSLKQGSSNRSVRIFDKSRQPINRYRFRPMKFISRKVN